MLVTRISIQSVLLAAIITVAAGRAAADQPRTAPAQPAEFAPQVIVSSDADASAEHARANVVSRMRQMLDDADFAAPEPKIDRPSSPARRAFDASGDAAMEDTAGETHLYAGYSFAPSPEEVDAAPDQLRTTWDPEVFAMESHQFPEAITEHHTPLGEALEFVPSVLTLPAEPLGDLFSRLIFAERDELETELHDHPIGLQHIPPRPPLLVEVNEAFLGPGELSQGFEIPTGSVWRPSFWVFGGFRTAISYLDTRGPRQPFTEWASRLDLFGQINLTGTERVVMGMRPLDEELGARREFSSYDFLAGRGVDGWNSELQTFFFEGDFGEIFPFLDPFDTGQLDYGFSVGRQPLLVQDGLLINEDLIDAATVTRNTLYGNGNLNLRISGVYAWNNVNRTLPQDSGTPNQFDPDASLFALLTESDFAWATVNLDAAYVDTGNSDRGSLAAFGASAIRRFHGSHHSYNSSLHFLSSMPTGSETPTSGQGELLFSQLSWTPHRREDLIYANTFWAIDNFTSPARGVPAGGPLGQTGILFASPALGRFGSALSNQARDVAGGSLGYQFFFDHTRQQVILEVGGRKGTASREKGGSDGSIAAAVRYQRAIGQHWIFILDGVVAQRDSVGVIPGSRVELQAKF